MEPVARPPPLYREGFLLQWVSLLLIPFAPPTGGGLMRFQYLCGVLLLALRLDLYLAAVLGAAGSATAAADLPPTFSMGTVLVQSLGRFGQQAGGTGVDACGNGDGVLELFHGDTS